MEFKPFKIGKYLLLEKLAVGGMAEVYRAKASGAGGFEKQLAIKRILPTYSENEEFRRMFEYEARLSSMLTHSNIVQVYDFTKAGETYLLAMEYVDGKNLRQFVNKAKKNGYMPPLEFASYVINEVCKGLDYAHKKRDDMTGKPLNIIHRDMSPQNVMLSYEGAVKIVDFGIAKAKDRVNETRSGVIKGKFGYMSPEQANGENVDHRTDIFSTGIILFELLTGRRLFTAENDIATLRQIQECNIPLPSRINPKIPNDLERILLKSLTKDRSLRYQDAELFHRHLLEFSNKHFPSFTQREVADILRETFKEEIETEKKRFEQIYRQSIPFSQGTAAPPPSEEVEDLEDVLDEVVTRSELGPKTGVTNVEDLPENEEHEVPAEPLEPTSYSPVMPDEENDPGVDVSSGGDTQAGQADFSEFERSLVEDTGRSQVSQPVFAPPKAPTPPAPSPFSPAPLPPPSSISLPTPPATPNPQSKRVDTIDFEMPLARERDPSIRSRTQPNTTSGFVSADPNPTPGFSTTQTGTGAPSFLVKEPAPPDGLNLKVSDVRREPTRRRRVKNEAAAVQESRRKQAVFSSRIKIGLVAGLTLYMYKIYLDGDVPALIEKIQLREPTQVVSSPTPAKAPDEALAASSTPPVKKTAPAVGECLLEVDTDPRGADVLVGDQNVGFTPNTVTRPCGHSVNITLRLEGYETESQNIVFRNATGSLYTQLKKVPLGKLEVSANQNAEIFVNNESAGSVGQGQRVEITLRAGRKYRVKLVNRIYGAEVSDEVSISEGSVTRKFFTLGNEKRPPSRLVPRPRKIR